MLLGCCGSVCTVLSTSRWQATHLGCVVGYEQHRDGALPRKHLRHALPLVHADYDDCDEVEHHAVEVQEEVLQPKGQVRTPLDPIALDTIAAPRDLRATYNMPAAAYRPLVTAS